MEPRPPAPRHTPPPPNAGRHSSSSSRHNSSAASCSVVRRLRPPPDTPPPPPDALPPPALMPPDSEAALPPSDSKAAPPPPQLPSLGRRCLQPFTSRTPGGTLNAQSSPCHIAMSVAQPHISRPSRSHGGSTRADSGEKHKGNSTCNMNTGHYCT